MQRSTATAIRGRLGPAPRRSAEGVALLAAIVALMWLLEGINSLTPHDALDGFGAIYPRDLDRLWGIFTSPFLHVSFQHLEDNTIPFAFMGVIIALRGAARLALVTLVAIVVGGLGTWLIAPAGTETVGASGIVFGYATYLLARGLFNRSLLEILAGAVVGVVWGGALAYSIVPHPGVSWQAHVCGAVGGVVAAWLFARPRTVRGVGGGGGASDHGREGGGQRPEHLPGKGHLHEALDRALSQ
ncbi:MAG: rhomboid family intramembrane serine protease [Solirubrobacteraceae bacterium]